MQKTALISLVFGVISLFLSLYGIFFGIIGFVLALHTIRKADHVERAGRGMAIGGMATSIIGAGYQIVAILILALTG
ncbi:hypothetical protein [Terribacillus sp. 7520-G]|uniref:hypothetical protein n=1 Tax=Terribacillus TaxID=459532 RepID=UPI000BA6998A|nr:hypothetical protein [Terribacillus sp. 7520-G]PAD39730.1 hypothetical protein CHH53_04305 [Terribacillus sp. 7520-G]